MFQISQFFISLEIAIFSNLLFFSKFLFSNFFFVVSKFSFASKCSPFFKIWVFDNFFSQYFSNLHFSQNILSFKILILLNIVTFQKFHLSKSLYSFFRFSFSSMSIFYTIFKFVKI